MEHSPYCERDIRPPQNLPTFDEKGDFLIRAKKKGMLYGLHYGTHPFDVIGWDGCCYPYAFSIHDFEPITGRVHQPPPVHQTFEAHNFVVCSFVPVYMIIIRRPYLRHIIIAILTAMKYCIMWMEIL